MSNVSTRRFAVRLDSKANFAFGSTNLRISQAEPTRSISGRGRVSQTLPRKSRELELRLRFRFELSSLQFPQDHLEIFRFRAIKKIGPSDFAKLFSNAVNFAAKI